jgi:hypothetical protein
MSRPEQSALDTQTHVALGRFVISFSRLLYALESSTIRLLSPEPNGRQHLLLHAALAERTAMPISSAFFSIFYKRWEGTLSEIDIKILKAMRRELDELIKERNRLMHDAWLSTSVGGEEGPHPLTRSRVRTHGSGVDYESQTYQPKTLEALVETADRLSTVVNGAVWYSRRGQSGPELHSRMEIKDDKVHRSGSTTFAAGEA